MCLLKTNVYSYLDMLCFIVNTNSDQMKRFFERRNTVNISNKGKWTLLHLKLIKPATCEPDECFLC